MKMTVKSLVMTIWLAALFSSANATDHTCTDCHATSTPGANDLINPLPDLCVDCHAERIAAGEHIVDIPVSEPDNTLPLYDGVMSCATCHDPHQPFAALRMEDPELCRQCHLK